MEILDSIKTIISPYYLHFSIGCAVYYFTNSLGIQKRTRKKIALNSALDALKSDISDNRKITLFKLKSIIESNETTYNVKLDAMFVCDSLKREIVLNQFSHSEEENKYILIVDDLKNEIRKDNKENKSYILQDIQSNFVFFIGLFNVVAIIGVIKKSEDPGDGIIIAMTILCLILAFLLKIITKIFSGKDSK